VTTFFAPEPPVVGTPITLGADVAHHARVRRLEAGTLVRLTDGAGTIGQGAIVRITKQSVVVDVAEVSTIEPPAPVHLVVPVADRDRMLWLAEKATELGMTSWRPLLW
jgi:16S rRNA (uracil1498-N3)-methyltransferase